MFFLLSVKKPGFERRGSQTPPGLGEKRGAEPLKQAQNDPPFTDIKELCFRL